MGKIFVWIKEPGMKARHVWISNSLKNLQRTVGGYIEAYPLTNDEVVICNEEGCPDLLNLPYNCTMFGNRFYGTIIFAGVSGEEFVNSGMMKEAIERLTEDYV